MSFTGRHGRENNKQIAENSEDLLSKQEVRATAGQPGWDEPRGAGIDKDAVRESIREGTREGTREGATEDAMEGARYQSQKDTCDLSTHDADQVEEAAVRYRDADLSLDATTLYLNEIGYIPLLNAEQEVQLAREVVAGSLASKNKMIESNLRLVVAVAKRFQNRGLPLLDLVEEGNLGLIRAVEKYNPELGYRFSTYATWWIKQSIDRALMNHAQTVRYPIHVVKDIQCCLRAVEQLRDQLEREPLLREIALQVGKPQKEVKRLLNLHYRVTSTDQSAAEDSEMSVVDTIAAGTGDEPHQVLELQNLKANVTMWLGKLSQRHRDVVVRRYGLQGHEDLTLEEIGTDVGITRERVRQLQIEALGKLRRMMERDGLRAEHLTGE